MRGEEHAATRSRRDPPSPGPATSDPRRGITLVDVHYGGDVSRVVLAGVSPVPGDSVRSQRDWLEEQGDALRRLLLHPPYGDPSMCVNLIVDPTSPEAQAGYVIMEVMGYPHFSGSNTICTVTALLETGHVPMTSAPADDEVLQDVVLESPSGLVRTTAVHDGTRVRSVMVECPAAHIVERDLGLDIEGHGPVSFDLVWSGCFYAVVDAAALGFALDEAERAELAAFGGELCLAATAHLTLEHPRLGSTGPLSFVCFAGPVREEEGAARSKSATYVHPGVVCSCPTGTGTAARMTLMHADGLLARGDELVTTSPSGSSMSGRLRDTTVEYGMDAVHVAVTGQPFTLGRTEVVVNRDDPMVEADGVWPLLDTRTC